MSDFLLCLKMKLVCFLTIYLLRLCGTIKIAFTVITVTSMNKSIITFFDIQSYPAYPEGPAKPFEHDEVRKSRTQPKDFLWWRNSLLVVLAQPYPEEIRELSTTYSWTLIIFELMFKQNYISSTFSICLAGWTRRNGLVLTVLKGRDNLSGYGPTKTHTVHTENAGEQIPKTMKYVLNQPGPDRDTWCTRHTCRLKYTRPGPHVSYKN